MFIGYNSSVQNWKASNGSKKKNKTTCGWWRAEKKLEIEERAVNDRERFPLLQETEIGRQKLFQFLQDLIISF